MAQLRQWKENNAPKIEPVNVPEKSGGISKFIDTPHDPNNCTKNNPLKNQETNERNFSPVENSAKLKFEPCKNLQLESYSEPKKKYQGKLSINPLAFKLTQLTRQFKLIQESNQKCFDVYPDDFHHKLKFRGELVDISDRLKAGGKLLNQLAKMQGVTFTRDNQTTLREFNQANGYLLTKFNEVIEQIDKLNIEFVQRENAPKDLKDS